MAEAVERTDELVREYLLFRGFTHTLRQLDAEIKADKEKGFRVRAARAEAAPREPGAGPPPPALPSGAGAALSRRRGDRRQPRVRGPRWTQDGPRSCEGP